ncbi:uncharacterized protein [Ptychodera flava]|uniref:uncharacterized protein n=1 Tax=Ptychodera flava TaxID=63121 RepID=UPI00396A7E5F
MAAATKDNSTFNVGTAVSVSSRLSGGMLLQWSNVTVKIKKKTVLKNVSGISKPGEMLALMGPSGSGKTTLLNVLSGRHRETESGSIHVNGAPLNKNLRRKICYVLQDDIFFNTLTLREQLVYTARLRLPSSMSDSERKRKVEEVVDILDIRKCLDTKIGSLAARGLSGGEKKRANIGCELMTDPAILLLDEPTSGLDSFAAYNLMTTLKNFAEAMQKTVLLSIHQPSSQMFYMCDRLFLLHEGETVYFGEAPKVVDYFSDIGFPCEKHYNPADFIMEKLRSNDDDVKAIMDASRNATWACAENVSTATGQANGYSGTVYYSTSEGGGRLALQEANGDSSSSGKWPTSFWDQYEVLTSRSFKDAKTKLVTPVMFVTMFSLAVIAGILWFQVDHLEDMIDERSSVLFMSLMCWSGMPVYLALSTFPAELLVINKERTSGLYRLSSYFFAKQTSEFPLIIFLPVLGHTIVYWLAGLNRHWPAAFFCSMGVMIVGAIFGQSLGMVLGLLFDDLNNALTYGAIVIVYSLVAGGLYIRDFPIFLRWAKYTSYIYYLYHSMVIVEFTNNEPTICNMEYSNYAECAAYNGTNVVEIQPESIFDFFEVILPFWFDLLVLIGAAIMLRILCYILLKYYRKPK